MSVLRDPLTFNGIGNFKSFFTVFSLTISSFHLASIRLLRFSGVLFHSGILRFERVIWVSFAPNCNRDCKGELGDLLP